MTIYERALAFLSDGTTIGLGSGRASSAFIRLLGERVKAGMKVRGVPTSRASEQLAREVGVPLVTLAEGMPLAVTVDGADEFDATLNMIKGYGRALVREKIVAASSKKLVILAGKDKEVPTLGHRGKLPVEVLPFALTLCRARITEMGMLPVPYEEGGQLFLTDNGNHILDCKTGPIANPAELESRLLAIPGVVGTGLFLGMADVVLIGDQDHDFALVEERTR